MEKNARWMAIGGWVNVVGGAGLALGSMIPGALEPIFELVVPNGGPLSPKALVITGVAGGLTLGFGVTMIVAARLSGEALIGAARAIAAGLVAWYAVDTAASLFHGSWQNAIANTGLLLVALPPALMLARSGAERASHPGLDAASARAAR